MDKKKKNELIKENQEMKKFFWQIKCGEIPQDEWKNKRDSLGFSALHYALMLDRKDIFLKMLKRQTRFTQKEDFEIFQKTHDLGLLSLYLKKNMEKDIFSNSSYEAKIVLQTIQIEQVHLKVQKIAMNVNQHLERTTRNILKRAKKEKNYIAYEQAAENLNQILNIRVRLQYKLCEIQDNINIMERELHDFVTRKNVWLETNLKEFENDNSTISLKFRQIYNKPDDLLSVLDEDLENCVLVYWKNILVVVPKTWIIVEPKEESFNRGSNNKKKKVSKPYGNSWFSLEAHEDREVLKKEYRILAKKYHPDYYPEEERVFITKVFQDILCERMMILKSFD